MRVVLDTNVFVSGVFFSGTPNRVLEAWRKERVRLVVSPDIVEEYRRVGEELSRQFRGADLAPILNLLAVHADIVVPAPLPAQVCTDPDDDKFLACALAAGVDVVCSGDKALLKTSGYAGVTVVTPRELMQLVSG